MRRGAICAVAALSMLLGAAPTALAHSKKHAKKSTARYYLALGDSLSVGYQPNANGVGVETSRGYTNDLQAHYAGQVKHLKLVELGCPGDTTSSMLTGKGNTASAKKFHCDRRGGSQVAAAVAFLKAHHKAGEVPLLTIDIGANDVDKCASVPTSQLGSCVSNGENSIKTNTPKILNALRKAAPKGTRLVAMNLYDPVLGQYFSSNAEKKALAEASVSFLKGVNQDIQNADTSSGFKTADVADTFRSYDQTEMVTWEDQQIPENVAYVCAWTFACTTPPVGPNIHANDDGYTEIAATFQKVIGKL